MKIATVIGARPQFIKAAALSRILKFESKIDEIIIHSGQHFDKNMSEVFFNELDILEPKYNLGISGGSHGEMTGRQLEAIEKVLMDEHPDIVMVYGDTNTTLAAALAAVKLHIPVAHVEAGLRSYNRKMPEEINRILVDHISEFLFAPTETAMKNLEAEGVHGSIYLSGDIMYDNSLYYGQKAEWLSDVLLRFDLHSKKYVLVTVHRAENTDNLERMNSIVNALIELGRDKCLIFPMHPRTRQSLKNFKLLDTLKTYVNIIEPLGYLDIVMLEKHASFIVTDSGGMQKEAYFHKTPCLTLRGETEWVELIKHGFNKLVDIDNEFDSLSNMMNMFDIPNWDVKLYGDGKTAESIVSILIKNSGFLEK